MPGALRNARDGAGERMERCSGHLLHELVCAGGTKWLETEDQKALRATHGSQRLPDAGKTIYVGHFSSTRPVK